MKAGHSLLRRALGGKPGAGGRRLEAVAWKWTAPAALFRALLVGRRRRSRRNGFQPGKPGRGIANANVPCSGTQSLTLAG